MKTEIRKSTLVFPNTDEWKKASQKLFENHCRKSVISRLMNDPTIADKDMMSVIIKEYVDTAVESEMLFNAIASAIAPEGCQEIVHWEVTDINKITICGRYEVDA